jgi:hypothetical protein
MEAPQWFYARNGQRRGPIGIAEAQRLFAQGVIQPSDLAWSAGMPQWKPVGEIPALRSDADIASIPVAAIAAQPAATSPLPAAMAAPGAALTMGYYTSAMGIPHRATDNLRGHAAPRGDTGDWPLDDARFQQFVDAAKYRRKITSAAKLFNLFLLLDIGFIIVLIFVLLFQSPLGKRANMSFTDILGQFFALGFFVGLALFYYLAGRATMRSRRWAPLTMFIIFMLGAAFYGAVGIGLIHDPNGVLGAIIGVIFMIAFAVVSWRSFAAIPRFLAQPAWCQEVIVKAGL